MAALRYWYNPDNSVRGYLAADGKYLYAQDGGTIGYLNKNYIYSQAGDSIGYIDSGGKYIYSQGGNALGYLHP